ncbi:hypothetical protein [Miltoncostaea marina]|uniref:hypothetical protein n=1 Tax=Miltoncostaea marina TaxID=2843215 RepID=UPI001C3C7038|nr:hypothetical protein [Miltoncostaea marina]
MGDERTGAERAEEALDGARREAAGKGIEDQGAEGGLTEATHGAGERNPERREGDEGRPA